MESALVQSREICAPRSMWYHGIMSENRVNLNDPSCEPTDEDFERLFRAAGDEVRAESARLNGRPDGHAGQQGERGKHSPHAPGPRFDKS